MNLSKLLGKEENKKTETFEGHASLYKTINHAILEIVLNVSKHSLESLYKYNNKKVKVTVEIQG